MQYGTHTNDVAHFRLIDPERDFYFFGDDIVIKTTFVPIELSYIPRSGIEGLLIGLDQNIIECLDWTSDDIRFYFLNRPYEARDIKFEETPPLVANNVQDAIEQLLDYTITQAGHVHSNLPILEEITDAGSGKIITDSERAKLQGIETGATRDQIAEEVPFEPDGDITSTNVQDAIEEVRNDTNTKLAGKSNVGHHHDASEVDGIDDYIINHSAFHTHANKNELDQITDAGSGKIITDAEREKLENIEEGATRDQLASEVPLVDAGNYFPIDNVEAALQRLGSKYHEHLNKTVIDQITSAGSGQIITVAERNKLAGIEPGATADQVAAEVPFTPSGDITSTNVQTAIIEVRNDTDSKIAALPHNAAELPYSNLGSGLSSTTTQLAIDELAQAVEDLEDISHTHSNKAILDQITSAGSGAIITAAERIKLAGIETGATRDQLASEVPYSNIQSGLDADTVQEAIDEVNDKVEAIEIESRDHNLLLNLQGGNSTERYHLTEDELTGLTHGQITNLHTHRANTLPYDDSSSEINATNVQTAIERIAAYTKEIGTFGLFQTSRYADQNIQSNLWTTVKFDFIKEDTFTENPGLFSLNTNTGIVTFQKKGKYEIYGSVGFDNVAYGTTRAVKVIHSNQFGSYLKIAGNNSTPLDSDFTFINASAVFDFDVGDTLQVSVFQDSGTFVNVQFQWTELIIKSAKDYNAVGDGSGPGGGVPADHPHKNIWAEYNVSGTVVTGRAVKLNDDRTVSHASNDNIDDANDTIGVTYYMQSDPNKIRVYTYGYLSNSSWNWNPNQDIFLDTDGNLTQTPTFREFSQRIARSISSTEIFIDIYPAIIENQQNFESNVKIQESDPGSFTYPILWIKLNPSTPGDISLILRIP